jgi:hypothetical protein
MQEISLKEIAVVKQPPEIEEWMESVSAQVSEKVQRAVNLVCTQETVKEVKQVRADLNKEFAEWEANRKRVRDAVMAPYDAFNEKYNQFIAAQYKEADAALRDKIAEVETGLKAEKEADARGYFDELAAVKHLDWLTYERLGLKITLSRSNKNIREEIETRLTAMADAVAMIENLPENREEIFAEYQRTLNLPGAMQTVKQRKEAIEANRKRQEEMQARLQAEKEAATKVEAAAAPEPPATLEPPKEEPAQEEPAEKYRVKFAVIGTLDELRALKAFLENGGFTYECE